LPTLTCSIMEAFTPLERLTEICATVNLLLLKSISCPQQRVERACGIRRGMRSSDAQLQPAGTFSSNCSGRCARVPRGPRPGRRSSSVLEETVRGRLQGVGVMWVCAAPTATFSPRSPSDTQKQLMRKSSILLRASVCFNRCLRRSFWLDEVSTRVFLLITLKAAEKTK
jgi:hypothetical protein